MADRGEVVRRPSLVYGVAFIYVVWLVGCVGLALDVGPWEKPVAVRIVFAVVAVPLALALIRTLFIGVYIKPDGVLIRGVLFSRRLAWTEIERFELGTWRGFGSFRCGIARLPDGEQITIWALNPPALGEELVLPLIDDLNGRLGRATSRSFAPATL